MVYGLSIVPTHGYLVEVEPLDGDIDAIRTVDQSNDGGVEPTGMSSGRIVGPEHVPTRMQWLDQERHPMPDFNRAHLLNVSARARDLIEQAEPETHQFLPVAYFDIDGKLLENRYFLFVGNRIDSVDRNETTLVLANGFMWITAANLVRMKRPLPPGADPGKPTKLVFNKGQIAGKHLWQDKHLSAGPYLSDALASLLRAAGMTGLALGPKSQAEEV